MIVEMMGKPAEHLKKAIEKHVGVLYKVDDIEVDRIEISEPKEFVQEKDKEKKGGADEGEEKMFTTFAECEFEIPSLARLTETMFDFMPSSVEVLEPSNVKMDSFEATNLMNNISGRMHRYDEFAKVAGERLRIAGRQIEKAKKIIALKDKEIEELKKGFDKKPSKKK